MFLTYLRRELTNRKKQTVIIAIGMALAIALVIIVSSIASGVKSAQSTVLQSVYGVGTDITVTKTNTPSTSGGRPSFNFGGSGSGTGSDTGSDGSTNLSQSRLSVAMGSGTLKSSAVTTVKNTDGVSAATGVLNLTNSTFSGSVTQNQSSGSTGTSTSTGTGTGTGTTQGGPGGGGFGGGNFSVDQFTVEGIPVSGDTVGPLTSTELTKGRSFTASDSGKDVVVLDKSYAKTESKTVGDTLTIGDTKFTVIGIVASTSSSSTTGSNTYIPLDTAQKLSSETGKVTAIYVSASSSSDVASLKTTLEKKLTSATVSTESDLASSVSGSLSTASSLVSSLGTWLSILVLAAAFLIAILFTISGVARRTREFGTLKAIGWSNGRITRQVAGESLVQGVIGGVVGAVAGLVGILVINIISPTISASASTSTRAGGAAGGAGGAGFPGGAATAAAGSGTTGGAPAGGFGQAARSAASSTTDVVLHAPVTVEIILVAIGLAIVGGLLAGALGGWRASRLRPAEALRSVA